VCARARTSRFLGGRFVAFFASSVWLQKLLIGSDCGVDCGQGPVTVLSGREGKRRFNLASQIAMYPSAHLQAQCL